MYTRKHNVSSCFDAGAFRRLANIATGALVEFDVALCFHWGQYTAKRTLPNIQVNTIATLFTNVANTNIQFPYQISLYLTVFVFEINALLVQRKTL